MKSASSDLAFGVADQQEFQDALARIRDGIGRMGAPFETVLEYLELPPEIASVGGQICLAEEALSGRQLTFEGYRYRGETHTLGVVDSVTHEDSPSFVRYQYPAAVPARVTERMADISDRVISHGPAAPSGPLPGRGQVVSAALERRPRAPPSHRAGHRAGAARDTRHHGRRDRARR